ncbi:MAG: UbiH/UbiF/VisC/COQ6 family ubiquinone biosynthesis hydroxylase [Gammaproteobacteria bacterium]
MNQTEKNYDVVIAGGGIVGATLACALDGEGLRVAVIEARPPEDSTDKTDPRVSAISRGSVQILESLGVWPAVAARRVSPFRAMQVWDASGSGNIHFDSADIGMDTLGYIVENNVMLAALWERLHNSTTIDVHCPARITTAIWEEGRVTLTLDDGRELDARLLIGADGADSTVRRLAGITTRGWDYHQTALVATLRTSHPHHETAWQRFLPGGPLAFLPLVDGSSSIVWTLPPEQAARLRALNEDAFIKELQEAVGVPPAHGYEGLGLGTILETGPRLSFPLRLIHADQYVKPRLALIGDAAHTVHPLAGQGVNLGISDAAALAEVVSEARAQGKDIGALRVLRRYERWRKGDNLIMVAALEGIKRLFAAHAPPLRWVRNRGLALTDRAWPVKNTLMRHAMGMAGDLPKRAQQPDWR